MSGCNFLTGVVLARALGIADFGGYALLFVVLIYTNYVQIALLVAPMQIFMPHMEAGREATLHSLAAIQIAFGACISAVAYAVHRLFVPQLLELGIAVQPVVFASCMFCYLQQDWLRRSYFVTGEASRAFVNDLISYGGQLLAIGLLLLAGRLSVTAAFLAIAASSAAATLFALVVDRRYPALYRIQATFGRCWHNGRHLILSWQFEWLSTHGILLLAGIVLGTTAAGAIRAAQNIVAPVYMLFQALENLVPVEASMRAALSGMQAASCYLKDIARKGGGILAVACLALAAGSTWLMDVVYGPAFSAFSHLVVWQAAIIFMLYFYLLAQYYYRAAGDTGRLLRASLLLSGVTVCGVALLIRPHGVSGVMAGVAAGICITIIYLGLGMLPKARAAS